MLAGADAVWDSSAPADEANIDLSGARAPAAARFHRADEGHGRRQAVQRRRLAVRAEARRLSRRGGRRRPRVKLWTRNKQDAARYFPDLANARPTWINAEKAIVDGEVVALDENGEPQFSLLQDRAGMGRFGPRGVEPGEDGKKPKTDFVAPIVYYVFDLLYHDGQSLLDVPLEQRKRLLRTVLREHAWSGTARTSRLTARTSTRPSRSRASRAWSPSCGPAATSPAADRRG